MSHEFVSQFNLAMPVLLGLVLILFDYRKMSGTSRISRFLLTSALVLTLASISGELLHGALNGRSGGLAYWLSWAAVTSHYLFHSLAYCFIALFLGFNINEDYARLRKTAYTVALAFAATATVLVLNLFKGFIFRIGENNVYIAGKLFALHLLLCLSFIAIILINTIQNRKQMNREMFTLVIISTFPAIIGELADFTIPGVHLDNSLFFASILFIYLFIVRRSALIDSLTGVYNRRGCDEYMLNLSVNRRGIYSFIMIDMDRFKEINDRFGHAAGDAALKDVAKILRDSIRRTDFAGRYGGDEFVVIARGQDHKKIKERIEGKLADFNAENKRSTALALSCGGGQYTAEDKRTPQEFLTYVDGLMYAQKAERRASA